LEFRFSDQEYSTLIHEYWAQRPFQAPGKQQGIKDKIPALATFLCWGDRRGQTVNQVN
jgi:hypothetical protein